MLCTWGCGRGKRRRRRRRDLPGPVDGAVSIPTCPLCQLPAASAAGAQGNGTGHHGITYTIHGCSYRCEHRRGGAVSAATLAKGGFLERKRLGCPGQDEAAGGAAGCQVIERLFKVQSNRGSAEASASSHLSGRRTGHRSVPFLRSPHQEPGSEFFPVDESHGILCMYPDRWWRRDVCIRRHCQQ